MIVGFGAARSARLDELLLNDPVLNRTRIAWLRDWAEASTASNLMAILDRLAYFRAIGLNPKITEQVSDWRFRQFGARTSRRAGLPSLRIWAAAPARHSRGPLLEFETSLSDAAVGMFVRLILGLFTNARKGIERRYQATAREAADLMHMLSSTIEC